MTKYHDNNTRIGQQRDTPIVAAREEIEAHDNVSKEYVCDNCHRTLSKLVDYSGENTSYYCNFCSIETIDTEELRSKSRIKTPDGPVELPSVSYPPDPNYSFNKKKVEYKGAFKTLSQRSGLRITSYTEQKGSISGSGSMLGKTGTSLPNDNKGRSKKK